MRNLAILAAVAALAGCVTSDKLRTKEPTLVVTSTKPARAVAACISSKWEATGLFGAAMPIENKILADGYSVSHRNGQMVQLMADVHEIGSGSTTSYYKVDLVAGVAKFEAGVKDCQ